MSEAKGRLSTISALGIVQIFAWGSSFYLPAVLAGPIVADMGWPLSVVTGGFSVGLLVSGLLAPRIGRRIREHGGRDVVLGGLALLAAGLAILAAATSIPIYVLGWVLIGAGMSGTLYDAAFSTLGRYYGYGARGAITTLTLFGGFASTVCWPLSAFLLAHGGWRVACLAYAAVHLLVGMPLVWRFLPRVEPIGPAGGDSAARAVPRLDPSERFGFALLSVILTLGGTIATIVSVHLITMLQARDVSLAAAVSLGALIGPSQVASRLFDMAIGKRLPAIVTLAAAAGLIAAGVGALASGLPVLALALMLYGAGNGIWSIARGAVPLMLFGPDRFPLMMGRLAMPNLIAQSLAPPASAMLLERAGAPWVLAGLGAAALLNFALAVALALVTGRRRRPRGIVASPADQPAK